jgi:hypothetical protein
MQRIITTLLQRCFTSLAIGVLIGFAPLADAQVHIRKGKDYVLRANLSRADAVPPEVLERHGIGAGPAHALLNVVVIPTASNATKGIAADVQAKVQTLAGYDLDVEMKPIPEGGGVSYLGAFSIPPESSTVRLSISARPEQGERLTLEFSERMPAR